MGPPLALPLRVALALALIAPSGVATPLDLGSLTTKCVAVPPAMGLCREPGWGPSEMRLPNLLGHRTLAQAVPLLASWQRLVRAQCHPHARTFLCSLLAPVCLDTFIQPCRSLCVAVRDNCAPVLACWGQTWPESLDCHRLPDEDGCLAPLGPGSKPSPKVLLAAACQSCPPLEELTSPWTALDLPCDGSFGVKAKLWRRPEGPGPPELVEVEGPVELSGGVGLSAAQARDLLRRWLLLNEDCARGLTTRGPTTTRGPRGPAGYLLVGHLRHGTFHVSRAHPWPSPDLPLPRPPPATHKRRRPRKCF
ncbi:secreted frizzled-related protein 2-like [Tachyglossus aculeatus]|uniref:secreted frizzled-related protein 2-like n=1 Tax=Tachyglossus aculeatus TaxID=9261 RepID=UPI0018F51808|nr:secreted frizzled-related protein 2-like [Tachyglossus aculeatus]